MNMYEGEELIKELATTTATTGATASLVSKVTNHIWGGVFDHEGRQFLDMAAALNMRRDTETPVRVAFAYDITTVAIAGTKWQWLLRSDETHGHFANVTCVEDTGVTVRCPHFHRDPAFALIMSLCEAVDYMRVVQRGAIKN